MHISNKTCCELEAHEADTSKPCNNEQDDSANILCSLIQHEELKPPTAEQTVTINLNDSKEVDEAKVGTNLLEGKAKQMI